MAENVVVNEEESIINKLIDQGGIGRAQVLVISTALLLNMVDGFDVIAMSFAVNSVGEQLQIAPDRLGIVFSVALAGMMMGAMFLAPLSDVIGRRKMMLISVTAIGISVFMTGFASSLWQLITLRLITGLGVGGMLASVAAITSEFAPSRFRSFAVVVVTAGYPLGAAFGGFIAAPLMAEYGWQSIFFAGGITTSLMILAIYYLVPESLQFLATGRTDNALEKFNAVLARLEKPPVQELPQIENKTQNKAHVFSLLSKSLRTKTLTLWTTFFFCFICLYFLMSWIPKLVVDAGMSESEGVYASIAFNTGAIFGIICLGWLSAKFGISRVIGTFLCSSAIGMIIFAFAGGINHLLINLLIIGFLLQGGFTGLYAVAVLIYPTELRSTGVGWAIGLGRIGAVIGPYAGGVFIAQGVSMEVNFLIFSIPLMIGGYIAYQLHVK